MTFFFHVRETHIDGFDGVYAVSFPINIIQHKSVTC